MTKKIQKELIDAARQAFIELDELTGADLVDVSLVLSLRMLRVVLRKIEGGLP